MKKQYVNLYEEKAKAIKKRENRLYDLIKACIERYSEEEMIETFNSLVDKEYSEPKEEEDIITDLVANGYCIFKPEYSYQGDQLKEYAETNIFPYYNEQQAAILF